MKILFFNIYHELASEVNSCVNNSQLFIADNYSQARDIIIYNEPDFILLGIQGLHDDIGIELLKEIRASDIKSYIIIYGLETDVSLAVECIKSGASDFIEKSKNQNDAGRIADSINAARQHSTFHDTSESAGKSCTVLFVDDDEIITKSIKISLGNIFSIDTCNNFAAAIDTIKKNYYDFIFLDIKDENKRDDRAGIKLLKEIYSIDNKKQVVMLSGWAETSTAVECLKTGVIDFLEKSVNISETIENVRKTLLGLMEKQKDKFSTVRKLHYQPQYRLIDIICESGSMKKIKNEIFDLSLNTVPVLISGETGTGKEMVASSIHMAGPRKEKNFVEVNCGSIPAEIFESELFGYSKGAFTGASANRIGKIELAHEGTLFLDEVESLPFDQQAKFLRVLEDKKIAPLGSNKTSITDFRIICATNVDLYKMVQEGKFRQDLFYRLNVYQIDLPPLRKRGDEDIVILAKHFLHSKGEIKIDNEAMRLLQKYDWPGNIRELKNLINKVFIVVKSRETNIITFDIVKECFKNTQNKNGLNNMLQDLLDYSNGNITNIVSELENMAVVKAYNEFNGNITKIANKVFSESELDKKNHRDRVRKILERNKVVLPD